MRLRTIFADALFEVTRDEGPGRFAGYAVTYGAPVRSGDIVRAGAPDRHIEAFLAAGALRDGHGGPRCGYFDVARSDAKGLWVEGPFHSTPSAQEQRTITWELVQAGRAVPISIGFSYQQASCLPVDPADRWGPQIYTEIEPFEVALCSVGNDPRASLTQTFAAPDGATFADHSQAVLAAVEEFLDRARGLRDLRSFEGRMLSQANIARLTAHADALDQASADLRELCAAGGRKENSAEAMIPLLMNIEGVLSRCGARRERLT